MTEIHVHLEAGLPADSVLAAAAEFSKKRLELWRTIDPGAYAVETIGSRSALVREGSDAMGGVWAEEKYDSSTPGVVRAIIQDSNVFRTGGTWEMRAQPSPAGGSHVEIIWNRKGKGVKGRFIVLMMGLTRGKPIRRGLLDMLSVLEQERRSSDGA